jgi:hypothetical protein
MEHHGEMMVTEENPDSSTRALWQSYEQSSGSKQEEWAKGIRICPCKVRLFILSSDFYMP